MYDQIIVIGMGTKHNPLSRTIDKANVGNIALGKSLKTKYRQEFEILFNAPVYHIYTFTKNKWCVSLSL